MIFGDQSDFAIEVYAEGTSARKLLGRICCWAKGDSIGSIDLPGCILGTSVNQFERTLRHLELHRPDWFGDESDQAVFDTIYEWNFGDNPPAIACPHGYGIYFFLTDDGDSFSGIESFIRRKEIGIQLMILHDSVADDGRSALRIYDVTSDGFHQAVESFITWYYERTCSQSGRNGD